MKASPGLAVIGPGRAGGALAIAAVEAGYDVQTVPGPSGTIPAPLATTRVSATRHLAPCDLVILATPDDVIQPAAEDLAASPPPAPIVAHLSGFASITRLRSLERIGIKTGCVHPLQTLPSPQQGARVLAGSSAAVTASSKETLRRLSSFAESLGMVAFDLDDQLKPLYHGGAAAVAMGVATALGVAAEMFQAAGVPQRHAQPLAAQVVDNCFRLGPDRSLTGPVVRSDLGTIAGHLRAAGEISQTLANQYQMLTRAAASRLNATKVTEFLDASPPL